MKKHLFGLALVSALAFCSAAQASAVYNYEYTFGDGRLVTGSFTGDANGNRIENLTNISAQFEGNVFNGSGNLNQGHIDFSSFQWVEGGAIASFDGLENNFMFSFMPLTQLNATSSEDRTDYFGIVEYSGVNAEAVVFDPVLGPIRSAELRLTEDSTWSVALAEPIWGAPSSVPEPGSAALVGMGLLAAVLASKKRKAS